MRIQGLAQVFVHRGVIKSHRQHVGDRSPAAANHLDARLLSDHGKERQVARIGDVLVAPGFDFQDFGRLIAARACPRVAINRSTGGNGTE